MKICVLGDGNHGKDTFGDMLAVLLGISATSSSWFACERAVWPAYQADRQLFGGTAYRSAKECFEDRANHRGAWYRCITDYHAADKTRLARELLADYDMYVGMRWIHQLQACRDARLFDVYYWVDASKRKPPEGRDSMSIEYDSRFMVLVDNNGSLQDLEELANYHANCLKYGLRDVY